MHDDAPAAEKLPARQFEQLAKPDELQVPAIHVVQVAEEEIEEYFPASQGVHNYAPDTEKLPAEHSWHVVILDAFATFEYVPA